MTGSTNGVNGVNGANGANGAGRHGGGDGQGGASVRPGRTGHGRGGGGALPPPPAGAVTDGRPASGWVHRAAALMVAAGGLALLVGASHFPVRFDPSDQALLRVAWTARPERVESCRTLGEQELEALPQHMRQRVVCEGTTARYRLEVRRDGQLLSSQVLRGGGLRHDRQLYVFQELPVPHGRSDIQVTLTRLGASSGGEGEEDTAIQPDPLPATDRDRRELDEHRRRVEDEVPASLTLSETVVLAPREVALLSYDQGARQFQLVRRTLDER